MANESEGPNDDDFGDDEMFAHRERYGADDRRRGGARVMPEFLRRAIENTVGSVSNTGSLSREALNYLLQQGDRGKREVVRIVAHEVGEFLRGVDLSSEVIKVLTSIQVEVNASVRFKPTKDGVRPEIGLDTNVSPSSTLTGAEPGTPLEDLAELPKVPEPEKKD